MTNTIEIVDSLVFYRKNLMAPKERFWNCVCKERKVIVWIHDSINDKPDLTSLTGSLDVEKFLWKNIFVLQLHKYSWVRCVQNKLKWKNCYFYHYPGDTISNLKAQYCLWEQISKFMSLMLGLSSCSRMVECSCVTSEEIKKLIFNKIFALCDFSGKQDIFMLTDLHWPHIFYEISCCANFVYDCRRIVWNGSRVIFDSLFQENLLEIFINFFWVFWKTKNSFKRIWPFFTLTIQVYS